MSKIGHLRVKLNGPRGLDGQLFSRLKVGGEQLLREGISLHLEVLGKLATAQTAGVITVWP